MSKFLDATRDQTRDRTRGLLVRAALSHGAGSDGLPDTAAAEERRPRLRRRALDRETPLPIEIASWAMEKWRVAHQTPPDICSEALDSIVGRGAESEPGDGHQDLGPESR